MRSACILFVFLVLAGCGKRNQRLIVPPPLTANVYYVGANGDDKNDGTTAAKPWQTIAKVNAASLKPGDRVLFEGGQTFIGTLALTVSGVKGGDIEIGSYGTGRATINAGGGTGIYIYNQSYIRIDNLRVTGGWNAATQSGNTGSGIYFAIDLPGGVRLGECAIANCDVSGFQQAGILVLSHPADGSQSGFSMVTIDSNTVHDNGIFGLTTLGNQGTPGSSAYAYAQVNVAYNTVYNNLGLSTKTDSHSGDALLIGDAGGGTIAHNVAYNNGWMNGCLSEGPAAIWCYDADKLLFEYNEAYDNGTGPGNVDGDGFDLDGGTTNCTMQYNYSHHNFAAGFLNWEYGDPRGNHHGNTIRYNISQDDAYHASNVYGGICIGPNCLGDRFYNNTLYSATSLSVSVLGGNGNTFVNNIFYATSGAGLVACTGDTSVAFFLNNDYYSGGTAFLLRINGSSFATLAAFRTSGNEVYQATGQGFAADPSLQNPGNGAVIGNGNPGALTSYALKAASPMLNTGFDLTTWGYAVGSNDFNGISIPYGGAYNIGACN